MRDKIEESKKKGQVDGCLPLGYDCKDRKLIINEKEASIIRLIYEQFNGNIDLFCQKNKFSKRYAQKILKLNLLSPKIKAAIMEGKHPKHLLLRDLVRKPFPIGWEKQENMLYVSAII